MSELRPDGRKLDELRVITLAPQPCGYAEGAVEVAFGKTKILVTASIERELPKWIDKQGRGWITAEYGMLPRATHTRSRREAVSGKQGGRTLEIQRLIGRSLRQAVNLDLLGEMTIILDCDVLCADGGTRTAAITGGWLALAQALRFAERAGIVSAPVSLTQVAAVSVGMVNGRGALDLCYEEDSAAEFDLNLVFNERRELIEIQGTGERRAINTLELMQLIELGAAGIEKIFAAQLQALASLEAR